MALLSRLSLALQRRFASETLNASFLTSIISLITSVTALGWQIINYMAGPDVMLIAPDQITVGSSEQVNFPLRGGGPYVHFIAQMSYVNKGAIGYNATVKSERVRVKIANMAPFEHRWFRFVSSDSGGPDGWKLQATKVRDAVPFPITAGTASSQETLFQPWPKNCSGAVSKCWEKQNYVTWDSFIQSLAASPDHIIEFEILADLYERAEPISIKCTVKIDNLDELREHRWKSPVCFRN